jgi:hypothetical protein
MFICGMRNDIRNALESISGNTESLETALYQWQTRNGGVVLSDVLDLMYI